MSDIIGQIYIRNSTTFSRVKSVHYIAITRIMINNLIVLKCLELMIRDKTCLINKRDQF